MQPTSQSPKYHFRFFFCSSEPDGGRHVIGFEVELVTRRPGEKTTTERLLTAESSFVTENMENVPMFQLRHTHDQRFVVFKRQHHTLRCPGGVISGGGNWYWTSYTPVLRHQVYLLNWLRHLPHYSKTEWDTLFFKMIWTYPGPLQLRHIRRFLRAYTQQNTP